MNCQEFEKLAMLYAAAELDASEREAVEKHADECSACAAVLHRELELAESLKHRESEEPSPALLAQCRGELQDALDDSDAATFWGRVGKWIPVRALMVSRPAWTAALCIFVGMALGMLGPRWLGLRSGVPAQPAEEAATPEYVGLENIGTPALSLTPASGSHSPYVELQYTQEQPHVLRGTLDNSDVRNMLIFIVQNGQRFDSGLRMDSLEALRTRTDDASVRHAFCYVARNDHNPGVRLKAIEALRGFEGDPQVRSVLLRTLLEDENPGARVEAINALRSQLEKTETQPDAQVVQVLQDRMNHDPNTYIRMQSAAAVRQIAERTPR